MSEYPGKTGTTCWYCSLCCLNDDPPPTHRRQDNCYHQGCLNGKHYRVSTSGEKNKNLRLKDLTPCSVSPASTYISLNISQVPPGSSDVLLVSHGCPPAGCISRLVVRVNTTFPSVSQDWEQRRVGLPPSLSLTEMNIPSPRLCRLSRANSGQKFGFHLTGQRNKPGESQPPLAETTSIFQQCNAGQCHISSVEEGSPAQCGGLQVSWKYLNNH